MSTSWLSLIASPGVHCGTHCLCVVCCKVRVRPVCSGKNLGFKNKTGPGVRKKPSCVRKKKLLLFAVDESFWDLTWSRRSYPYAKISTCPKTGLQTPINVGTSWILQDKTVISPSFCDSWYKTHSAQDSFQSHVDWPLFVASSSGCHDDTRRALSVNVVFMFSNQCV